MYDIKCQKLACRIRSSAMMMLVIRLFHRCNNPLASSRADGNAANAKLLDQIGAV